MKKIIKKNFKLIIIISLIILVFIYTSIINMYKRKIKFVNDNLKIYGNNLEKTFKIDKILLCNSANAIDLSEDLSLTDLSLYQYTDIAIYIDNGEELNNKTTISKLYIDNIELEGAYNNENKSLSYKNLLKFASKEDINIPKENEIIDFNIIYTNEQNENATYEDPTFFTDCSNPISLEYINYNIRTGYKMDENKTVAFDGNILNDAGVPIEELECRIRFRINIINNENEKYSCPVNFKLPLSDIYKGTTIKTKTTKEKEYVFFREV